MAEQPAILYKHRYVDGIAGFDTYRKHDGYAAFEKALGMAPDAIIDEIRASGLRGRGGAGFPTHIKWSAIPKNRDTEHYLVINADEGEPGTAKDRDLMNHIPHLLIEGCLIAMHAIRASKCYIYLRGEYVQPWQSVQRAINEAYRAGFLGKNVLDSGLDFEMHTHLGAGSYECGEESALMSSLMGERGMPRLKPPSAPLPMVSGAWQKPTVVNNVETVATAVPIITLGGAEYAKLGPADNPRSRGTKITTVSGHVNRPGNYEMLMGTTVREMIEIAGGVRTGHTLKCFIPGGSSTAFLMPQHLDTPMDYESMQKAGSALGSGALIVMDETTAIVPVVKRLVDFYHHESCGKCTPCREGTDWMAKIYDRLVRGGGREQDLDLLLDLCDNITMKSFCALGDAAIVPVQSSIKWFRDEYLSYIRTGRDLIMAGV
jgi:NADH-quinone oxidoreductase subunit F